MLLVVFLIYPALKDIKSNSIEVLSNREKTAFIHLQSKELDKYSKSLTNYKGNLDKIDQLFIDPKNPVNFIKFLEKTSSDLNIEVSVNLVTPSSKEINSAYHTSSFLINVIGNFQNIIRFSEKLETSPYLLKINSLSINKLVQDEENQKSSNLLGASFMVQVVNKQS